VQYFVLLTRTYLDASGRPPPVSGCWLLKYAAQTYTQPSE